MTVHDCPFCEHDVISLGGFAETPLSYILYNYKPIVQGHVLVIPKRHVAHYDELTEDEVLDMGKAIQALYPLLHDAFHAVGYNVILQDGENSGQSVYHLHFHVIPRRIKDISNFRLYLMTSFKWIYRPKLSPSKHRTVTNMLRSLVAQKDSYLKPLHEITWLNKKNT